MTRCPPARRHPDAVIDAAVAGDDRAFALLVERYRRELHGHCYRMLNSFEQAEDAVQETLLRAWCSRTSFAGRSTFRTWLYRIATNVCVDEMRRHRRRHRPHPLASVEPLAPLDGGDRSAPETLASGDSEPDTAVLTMHGIEHALRAAIELLPPRQRAVLILRDVLRWPAVEVAELLATSVVAVNSALQRARATLEARRPPAADDWVPSVALSDRERALVTWYVDALRRADVATVVAVARVDFTGIDGAARWTLSDNTAAVAA